MDTLQNLATKLWGFVSNPPTEVTQASITFVNETAKCLSNNFSTLAKAVLDSFKGIF